ncbi:MAG TPA: hypothetical protein VFV15_07030 [Moraxellaceae bacterium]|nr:hypothetical protein [Moraxellaceae bacterium]
MKMLTLLCLGLALAGCTTPHLSRHLGEPKEAAELAMRVNKDPRGNRAAATTDGQISNAAQDRYHNAYGKPTTVNVYNIGVGAKGSN